MFKLVDTWESVSTGSKDFTNPNSTGSNAETDTLYSALKINMLLLLVVDAKLLLKLQVNPIGHFLILNTCR